MKIYGPAMRPLKRSRNKLSSNFQLSFACLVILSAENWDAICCDDSGVCMVSESEASKLRERTQTLEYWSNNDINNKLQSRIQIVGCNWKQRKTAKTGSRLWKEFLVNLWVKCVVGGFQIQKEKTAFRLQINRFELSTLHLAFQSAAGRVESLVSGTI